PLQIERINTPSKGILPSQQYPAGSISDRRLPNVVDGHQIGRPFKISSQPPPSISTCENLSQAKTQVERLSILGATGNTKAPASPKTEVPRPVVKGRRVLRACHSGQQQQKRQERFDF